MSRIWTPPQARNLPEARPGDPGSLRLLVCNICQTIEELPAYSGSPDADVLLQGLVRRHGHRVISMFGRHPDMEVGMVWRTHWDDPEARSQIIKQIRESSGHTGLGDEFYATKNTYSEEAGKCFNAHRRPVDCVDYKTPAKLLTGLTTTEDLEQAAPDLKMSKREIRRRAKHAREAAGVYLCDFCPVKSVVMQKLAGTYSAH